MLGQICAGVPYSLALASLSIFNLLHLNLSRN
jgi:hypothetical protein